MTKRRRKLRKPWLYTLRILLLPLYIAGLYQRGYFSRYSDKRLRKPWRVTLQVISAWVSGAGGVSLGASLMSPMPVMAEDNPIETAKTIAGLQKTNVENPAVLKTYLVRDYAAKSEENGLQASANNLKVQLQAPAVVTEPNLSVMKVVIEQKDDSPEEADATKQVEEPKIVSTSSDAPEADTTQEEVSANEAPVADANGQEQEAGSADKMLKQNENVIDLTDVPVLSSIKPTQAETTNIKFMVNVLHLALNDGCDDSVLLKQVDLTALETQAVPQITVTSNVDTSKEGFYTAIYHVCYDDGSSEDAVLPIVVAMTSEQKAAEEARQKEERLNRMRTLSMVGTDRTTSMDKVTVTSSDTLHGQIMNLCSQAEGRAAGWGGVLQCTDVANWFIVNAFGKDAVHGNGRDIAGALLARGYDDIVRVDSPAPGVLFSQYSNSSALGALYGHVGYINAVSDNGQTAYVTEGQGSNGNYVEYTPYKIADFANKSNYCFVTTKENAEALGLTILH